MQICLVLFYNLGTNYMSSQPQRVNADHFSTDTFPEIIAFCDRDETTHVQSRSEESYEYRLHGKSVYRLKKFASQWELMELENNNVIRVSTGRSLGMVLWQALRFTIADKEKQEVRVNILIPVAKTDVEKTLAFMYYYGGYPGNFLESSAELSLIVERFVDPELSFLSYSYIPAEYLDWLREVLKKNGIIQDGARMMWVYKK